MPKTYELLHEDTHERPAAGLMHSLMYFPFIILLGVTTTLEIDHQLPSELKFLHGGVYKGYSLVGDVAGVLSYRRRLGSTQTYGPRQFRPYRIRKVGETQWLGCSSNSDGIPR